MNLSDIQINFFEVEKMISRLPYDLVYDIHRKYVETEYIINLVESALITQNSYSLNIIDLRPLIPLILSKPYVLNYFYSNNETFKYIYDKHKIENSKHFLLLNKGDSFALSWLMCLYH